MKLSLISVALLGCAGAASDASNAVTAGQYEALQLACVNKAATRAEADSCRNAVKAQFGRAASGDGGGD